MKTKSIFATGLALLTIGGLTLAPSTASADWGRHRDRTDWRDIAIGAGVVGAIGLLSHNNTLAIAGGAGLVYSAIRADEECDSNGRWFHWERGCRVFDRDYRPEFRERERFVVRDRDFGHERGRDFDRGSDRGRDSGGRGNDRGRDHGHDRGGRF